MNNKKQWTLNTVKAFYKEVEKRFENVQTKEEAVEVFRGLFPSESIFYKKVNRHILGDIYKNKKPSWKEAKIEDINSNYKYSLELLKMLFITLKYPVHILYQKLTISTEPRIIIYSKKNTVAIVLNRGNIISIHEDFSKNMESWIRNISNIDEVLEVRIDEELHELKRNIRKLYKRLNI